MSKKYNNGCILVDLDGTLAHHDQYMGATFIGEPIKPMIDRVKRWLNKGIKVKIFTARSNPTDPSSKQAIPAIKEWSKKIFGQELEVCCDKDYTAWQIWDDRAVQIIPNTGLRADGREDEF